MEDKETQHLHPCNLQHHNVRLTGTLTHLTALAAETAHALLLPLLAHTGRDLKGQLQLFVRFQTVLQIENLAPRLQAEGVKGQKLVVFNLVHERLDGGRRVDLVGFGSNKHLHV